MNIYSLTHTLSIYLYLLRAPLSDFRLLGTDGNPDPAGISRAAFDASSRVAQVTLPFVNLR